VNERARSATATLPYSKTDISMASQKVTANVTREEFPVPTKQWAEEVGDEETNFSVMQFSDKIMLTISQGGKLAHWVCSSPFVKNSMESFSDSFRSKYH
jgi:hypothetical protein